MTHNTTTDPTIGGSADSSSALGDEAWYSVVFHEFHTIAERLGLTSPQISSFSPLVQSIDRAELINNWTERNDGLAPASISPHVDLQPPPIGGAPLANLTGGLPPGIGGLPTGLLAALHTPFANPA
jgi:hypothetical protein